MPPLESCLFRRLGLELGALLQVVGVHRMAVVVLAVVELQRFPCWWVGRASVAYGSGGGLCSMVFLSLLMWGGFGKQAGKALPAGDCGQDGCPRQAR